MLTDTGKADVCYDLCLLIIYYWNSRRQKNLCYISLNINCSPYAKNKKLLLYFLRYLLTLVWDCKDLLLAIKTNTLCPLLDFRLHSKFWTKTEIVIKLQAEQFYKKTASTQNLKIQGYFRSCHFLEWNSENLHRHKCVQNLPISVRFLKTVRISHGITTKTFNHVVWVGWNNLELKQRRAIQ